MCVIHTETVTVTILLLRLGVLGHDLKAGPGLWWVISKNLLIQNHEKSGAAGRLKKSKE